MQNAKHSIAGLRGHRDSMLSILIFSFSFHLCTHKEGFGHCGGDSGGPLFILNDKNRSYNLIIKGCVDFRCLYQLNIETNTVSDGK